MQPNSNSDLSFMDLLREKGITVRRLSDELDITERAIYAWLSGESTPRLTVAAMKKLCLLLDLSIHELPDSFARNPNDIDSN